MEPVVIFFVLGVAGGLARTDLKFPVALYEALTIFLLLAIGLKGGVELARYPLLDAVLPSAAVLLLGVLIPIAAFPILLHLGKLKRPDAASIAAHYGSVSVVTFAVGAAYLNRVGASYEGILTVFLVLLEVPAIVIGVILARGAGSGVLWKRLVREVVFGKSIFLLLGGLIAGWVMGPHGIAPLDKLFFDLFKGVLALFLLEMGLVASRQIGALRSFGPFLAGFAVIMPLISATLGLLTGLLLGLSAGGMALLATLSASASYIAAPAAMRIAVPDANPALSLGASLGVTFPFNLVVGIPIYYKAALWLSKGAA